MIIKSLSRKSNPGQLIQYATRYLVKEGKHKSDQEHMMVLVRHNIRSRSVEGFLKEFKENESFRIRKRKDSVVLYHTIISFSPKDKAHIIKPMLEGVAKQFIELRNPKCLHLAVAHLEKKHTHIHVLTSGVQINGKSSRVSKQAFRHILTELENYQQQTYPQLMHSVNTHEKSVLKDKEALVNHLKLTRSSRKLVLHNDIDELYKKACSLEEFEKNLMTKGYRTYYRNGTLQGIESDGLKYRFSRLGVAQSDLDQLNIKGQELEQKAIELRVVRNTAKQEKIVSQAKTVSTDQSNATAENELEAIRSIREKVKENELMQEHTNSETIRSTWLRNSGIQVQNIDR